MLEKRVANLEKVLRDFIEALNHQVQIDQVILFGSYCRRTERDYSDIDIAVVSPNFEGGTEQDYLLVNRVARKVHPLIEVIPYNSEDFRQHESGDFIDEILKKGRVIYEKTA